MAKDGSLPENVPQLVVQGFHPHPGARAVTGDILDGLYCSFCGQGVRYVRVADTRIEWRLLPMFDMLGKGLALAWSERMDRRCAQVGKLAASAAVDSVWFVDGRALKDTTDPAARDAGSYADHAVVFGRMLAAGEDWLSVVKREVQGKDRPVAAVSMLGLSALCLAAWEFNPAVAIDAQAIARYRAFRGGDGAWRRLPLPEREGARFDVLLEAWADARPEVQDEAVIAISGGRVGGGLATREAIDRWAYFSAAQKQRAFALFDRDMQAIADGTLTTADRAWRHGRLKSIAGVINALRG